MKKAELNVEYIRYLENESIYILREAASKFDNVCLLFSGGKDSIVLAHLSLRAFYPSLPPFRLLHIDTGHNFKETIEFRDNFVRETNFELIVGSVEDTINRGKVVEETGYNASRNKLQTITLLETIENYQFDAALGGGRRDEEKARAKERIFSHRDEFGQWNPKNQRPELWNIYNGRKMKGEHFRVFPLSNWTELDIWYYIKLNNISLPTIYYSHEREVFYRDGVWLGYADFMRLKPEEMIEKRKVRCRTVGDITCTGLVLSEAKDVDDIIEEILLSNVTERGSRWDDKRSSAAMEERKIEGYF